MFKRTLIAAIAAVTIGGVLPAAHAETVEDMSFSGMVEMKMMDKNKDGMVSKKEFLDSMSKVWDMRTKKAKMEKGMMTRDDFEKMVLMYLRAGS